jgi:hypothetical protein
LSLFRWKAAPPPTPKAPGEEKPDPLAGVDLENPRPWGYMLDRDGKMVGPSPHLGIPTDKRHEASKLVLEGSVKAAKIADALFDPDPSKRTLPEGWKQVPHPELEADMAKAGAVHLVGPNGLQYVAFSEVQAKKSVRETLAQGLGISTERTKAAAKIGFALSENYDVTYAGVGRGGALAKLACEAASTWQPGGEDATRPKVCVAINSTAVAPGIYNEHGLAEKNHARTTINLVNELDARIRLTGYHESRTGGATSPLDKTEVLSKPSGLVVGGPREGERRTGDIVGNTQEPKAFANQLITFSGKIEFDNRHATQNLEHLNRDIQNELVRKTLVAASRSNDQHAVDHFFQRGFGR